MLNLKSHTSTHTGENSYKCDVCYKIFTRTNYLIKHMRIHSGKKALKCETCAKVFSQTGHLNVQKKLIQEKPF